MAFTKDQAKASDRRLAELTDAFWVQADRLSNAVDALHRAAGERRRAGARAWHLTEDQAREQARLLSEDPRQVAWRRQLAAQAATHVDEARGARDSARAALRVHEAEWRDNERWSRFFLVQGGHIHQSPACHTLRPTTRLGWLPDLSGESEAEAVAIHGSVLCSHCFSSAPTEWTSRAQQEVDPTVCPGKSIEPGSLRRRVHGGWGFCGTCGQRVTVTSVGNVRKHKKQEADA